MISDLAKRSTVTELVNAFARAEADVRTAFAMIVAAETAVNAVFAPGSNHTEIKVCASSHGRSSDFANIERTIVRMRRAAWKEIVERLELHRMQSVKRNEAMHLELDNEKLTPPPLNEEALLNFIAHHSASLPAMINEAVREVFDWLRPRSSMPGAKLKTNQKNARLEVGPKVVINNCLRFSTPNGVYAYTIAYGYTQNFVAMENVFRGLAGKGATLPQNHSDIQNAIENSGPNWAGETEFFAFKCYGNMNLHIRFKRLDLLAKLNQMAGGKNLRPAEGG